MSPTIRSGRLLVSALAAAAVTGGVVASSTAGAAPVTPRAGAVTEIRAELRAGWVKTTDAPTGITVDLPGKATVEKHTDRVLGHDVTSRGYLVQTGEGFVVFAVTNVPDSYDIRLEAELQAFVEGMKQETGASLISTDAEMTTVEGRPALDARIATDEGERMTGSTLLVDGDRYLVQAVTVGPEANEKALDKTHREIVDSMRIP
ncbi:hypothetical protein OTC26_021140 [Streptomyces tirandamycinicus]|uniref:hypothetical protein n=1 Tax=Streptomyces tirandamycinicus TaxID=2174846 RepID=UPI002270E020|nr:hypothetical protein [Streptomyces tirandamycinicus]MCY0980393.1 hypothetical protein [Streptomyces tirandamycinicus]